MRVYEFAKQQGLSTKEVVELLKKGGFEVTSHMAVLDDSSLEFLNNSLKGKGGAVSPSQKSQEKAPSGKKGQYVEPQKKISVQPQTATPVVAEKQKIVIEKHKEMPIEKVIEKATESGAEHGAPLKQIIAKPMTVVECAQELDKHANDVILTLLKWKQIFTKNQLLSTELVARLARHYGAEVVEAPKATIETDETAALKKEVTTQEGEIIERMPVVAVVGHVDHGKTTLLDFIRSTRVAAREKGGITQHLGAYEAKTPHGNIVFLDTPGHEAFSKIRMRGVKVADIAVLVIAADDSIMPQTIEAIKHIKAMGVPVIAAINKIDKVEPARIEVVKRDLANHGLLPEEWGGDVICIPISAKLGTGVDKLLEMIILQSQLMELRANISGPAQGYVLESKLEKGRGPVATIICQQGTLHVGDNFICGNATGRVSSLVDSSGRTVRQVLPSVPVLVAGFSALPQAGDRFEVASLEELKKARVSTELTRPVVQKTASDKNAINIIIKTDTNSSKEAILGSITKLSKKLPKGFNIIQAGIGGINESDIMLAANTKSMLIGLHIKAEPNAMAMAQKMGVSIKFFDIIYKMLDELELISHGAKEIKMVKTKIGEAVVLKVFDIKDLGVIAGAQVKEGRFSKDGQVVIFRRNKKVGEGSIKSLQRDRKPVKEVHTGYECAFLIDGFNDWEVDDRVECYLEVPEGKK